MWILEPHDGNFGISGWAKCDAPTCLHVHPRIAGSFAIARDEPHFVDIQRHQHVHANCGRKMVKDGIAVWKDDAQRKSA